MRQIVLDTETTGLSCAAGHRIIEIGCLELYDRQITEQKFHVYLNPGRQIDVGAFQVHGISNEFLADKPYFKDIANDFLEFIAGAELIIHNAPFDIGFLETELKLANLPISFREKHSICDTLLLAKAKHPGQRNSLDALCKRYEIDNSHRTFHGALLDAAILARVYLSMTGGQGDLFAGELELEENFQAHSDIQKMQLSTVTTTSVIFANEEELKRHEEFMKFLHPKGVKPASVSNC